MPSVRRPREERPESGEALRASIRQANKTILQGSPNKPIIVRDIRLGRATLALSTQQRIASSIPGCRAFLTTLRNGRREARYVVIATWLIDLVTKKARGDMCEVQHRARRSVGPQPKPRNPSGWGAMPRRATLPGARPRGTSGGGRARRLVGLDARRRHAETATPPGAATAGGPFGSGIPATSDTTKSLVSNYRVITGKYQRILRFLVFLHWYGLYHGKGGITVRRLENSG